MGEVKMNLKERCETLKACNVDYMKAHVQSLAEKDKLRRENEELRGLVDELLAERERASERAYYEGVSQEMKETQKNTITVLCRRLLDHYPRSQTVRKTIIEESEKLYAEIDQ